MTNRSLRQPGAFGRPLLFAVVSALSIGACARGAHPESPLRSTRPVDEIVSPEPVWEEARAAMEAIVARSSASILIPGPPALQCTLSQIVVGQIALECPGVTLSDRSLEGLVRRVNAGDVKRTALLNVLRDPARLLEVLGIESGELLDTLERAATSDHSVRIRLKDSSIEITIDVLDRGVMHVEITSEIGKSQMSRTMPATFDELREIVREQRPKIAADIQRVLRTSIANAVLDPLFALARFDDEHASYAGISLGMTKSELHARYPYDLRHLTYFRSGKEITRIESARSNANTGPPHGSMSGQHDTTPPDMSLAIHTLEQIDLLDGRVMGLATTNRVMNVPMGRPETNEVCDLALAKMRASLSLDATERIDDRRFDIGCILTIERHDRKLVVGVSGSAARLQIQGELGEVADIRKRADDDELRAHHAKVCGMCTQLRAGQKIGTFDHFTVLSIDRKTCKMRIELTSQGMPTGGAQPSEGSIFEQDCDTSDEN